MTPDEELADLQKKYALLEGDRKAYYETSQWTIKQNRETIAAGKEENKELRLQLGACQSAKGGKPEGGANETAELEKLLLYAKDLRKKYDEVRLLTSKKQGMLNIKLDKIKDLERDAVRPKCPPHPADHPLPSNSPNCPPLPSRQTLFFFGAWGALLRARLRTSRMLHHGWCVGQSRSVAHEVRVCVERWFGSGCHLPTVMCPG
jgi:hypothetical protein